MKQSIKTLAKISLVLVLINSGAPTTWAQTNHSKNNSSFLAPIQSTTASGQLLSPLFHPEGRCAGDLPGVQVFYEDTETYSDATEVFPGFTDVGKHASYCYSIRYLVSKGAIGGYADGTFRPYNVVTRGQFSKMIVLTFEYPLITPTVATYADVLVGSTFFSFVETASAHNLVTGQLGVSGFWNPCIPPNGGLEQTTLRYFRPCLNITRGQMAKPLSQAAGYSDGVAGRRTFFDISSTYYHYQFIERLAMHISLDEVPFDTPSRPICYGTSLPCYHPGFDVRRNDAAQLIYLAFSRSLPYRDPNVSHYGRAFPRRFRVVNNGLDGGYDGIQGFVSTPSTNPPGGGHWIAGPLAIGSVPNFHFIESGPYRTCSASSDEPDAPLVCLNHPFASSATSCTSCMEKADVVRAIILASGGSYEYRSVSVPEYGEWWSEFYHPGLQYWRRIITVGPTDGMGTAALREVNGAAETSDISFASGNIRYTNVRAHLPGEPPNTWHGWCPNPLVFQRFMFNSGNSACPPPGVEPFSWDVSYNP